MASEQSIDLEIVGSTKFGRYSKISIEQTFNMIISDGWLVDYAGHQKVGMISSSGRGRGIYSSDRFNHMIAVVDNRVVKVSPNLSIVRIGTLETSNGEVYIDENNANQIAICDQSNIYIYNFVTGAFDKVTTSFIPGYIEFQDGYFIAPASGTSQWRLSAPNDGFNWPEGASNVGLLQTKPDEVQAVVRFPGKGNLVLVFGRTVTEFWYDTGINLFPYQKNTYNNIDYGCINAATIATSENKVIWVGINEKSGPSVMFTDGNAVKQISDDGINFRLANLDHPEDCFAFCFKQDGHPFYQVTWPRDGLTLLIDFETGKFFTLTNEYMGAHIAKRVAYFNNTYYFVSETDGNLYELNSDYTTYDGAEIPRIRVCPHIRMPDQRQFIVKELSFTIEQGSDSLIQRIDLSISRDGGASFSNSWGQDLNRLGRRPNRLNWQNLGMANDFVPQFRFWGHGRFVATNGLIKIYR